MSFKHLPDTEVEELASLLERMAGGPCGAGMHYVLGTLGLLASQYGQHQPGCGVTVDLARILGELAKSRRAVWLAAMARMTSRGGPAS